jgi:hypothetical protein
MDVNEKIVEEWLRRCKGQFTMTGIRFKTIGPKGGSNYSDIDILAINPKDNKVYDYEVKWRSVPWVAATPAETSRALAGQLLRPERKKCIREIVGNRRYQKVFITPELMIKGKKARELRGEFKRLGIQIISFEDVLVDLIKYVKNSGNKGRHDSETLQLIRMLRLLKINVGD